MNTAQEKNEQVLAVLRAATKPMGPTEIAIRIKQPWCCVWGFGPSPAVFGSSAVITPVLRRIGAVRHNGGKYTMPVNGGAA